MSKMSNLSNVLDEMIQYGQGMIDYDFLIIHFDFLSVRINACSLLYTGKRVCASQKRTNFDRFFLRTVFGFG